ncbi:MAG: hypothetical protein OEZ01_10385, partial [Candidatus Heimdallarchaeota archaeon]|nr:hypothetical protein [Candidatus Heimdallarchaeota archaeon]
MKKDSRLSFRLSNNLSGKIQKIIDDSNGEIRDRSEFGTKAVEFYLNSLTNSISRKLTIINALISIIDTEKLTDPDILKAKEELEAIAIKIEDSGRIRDDHPKYAELILLKTVFDRSVQREMKYEIRSATY